MLIRSDFETLHCLSVMGCKCVWLSWPSVRQSQPVSFIFPLQFCIKTLNLVIAEMFCLLLISLPNLCSGDSSISVLVWKIRLHNFSETMSCVWEWCWFIILLLNFCSSQIIMCWFNTVSGVLWGLEHLEMTSL